MKSIDLIAAHLLGDYILQTDHMAKNKLTDPKVRAKHVSLYVLGFVPLIILQRSPLWRQFTFLVALWVSHFLTDSRRWASGAGWAPKPILVDQSLHAIQLALLKRIAG